MSGLIGEIQNDASSDSVSVAQLLRRIKIAASKLKLAQLEEWVEHELSGYPESARLPNYRVLGGVPMAHHRNYGWRMMALGPSEQVNSLFSCCFFRGSVVEIETYANTTGYQLLTLPEFLERPTLQNLTGVDKIGLSVDGGKFKAALNGVRNKALDWALAVEAAGVTGQEFSFTAEERNAAQKVTNNFYGDHARINQNSTDQSNNIILNGNLFGELKTRFVTEVGEGTERTRILSAVDEMEAQRGKPGYAVAYANFIALAANHMQIVQPFIGGLTSLLGG